MRVKALRDCFVRGLHKEGEEFEYNGRKNSNLQPLGGAKWPKEKPPAAAAKSEARTAQGPINFDVPTETSDASGDAVADTETAK